MKSVKILLQSDIDKAFEEARNNTANEEQRSIVYAWALANYGRYNIPISGDVKQIVDCECGNGNNCCKVS